MSYIAVLSTIDNIEKAKEISHLLLEDGCAACINIIPQINSIYLWKGNVVEDCEYLMLIKTRKEFFEQVKLIISEHHSYEVPEIIALDITQGLPEYFSWIDSSLKLKRRK